MSDQFPSSGVARLRARLGHADLAGTLITFADRVESAGATVLRGSGRLLVRGGLGLTGGLAWRALAALSGIGLTAALVTGLSAGGGEAQVASLSVVTASEARPVRDVRQEPRAVSLGDEGWIRVSRPIAMFGLESPELERQSAHYEVRRSQDGGRREDVLAFGGFGEARPHLVLRLLQEHGDATSQPFVIALVRMAAMRGISIQRSGTATMIGTRFGPMETTDATFSDGDSSRACIGFRHEGREANLTMSGWWCGGAQRPADRQQLICLIDRLDLLTAGDDPALRAAFSRTELNRQPACSTPRLSATGRKASWLDFDAKAPPLKTAARR